MTTTFTDDFNRANGVPGNGWVGVTDQMYINTNTLRIRSAGILAVSRNAAGINTPNQRIELTHYWYTNVSTDNRFWLRANNALTNGYYVRQLYSGGIITWYLYAVVNGVQTLLDSVQLGGPGTAVPVKFEAIGTAIRFWSDGILQLEATNAQVLDGPNIALGAWNQNFYYDNLVVSCDPEPSLSVTEPILDTTEANQTVHLVGVSTNWTPGSPGDPTFTCAVGTINGQSVVDENHATLDYTPAGGVYLETFTDPSTGETALVGVGFYVGTDPSTIIGQLNELYEWLQERLGIVVGDNLPEVLRRIGEYDVDDSISDAVRNTLSDWRYYLATGIPNEFLLGIEGIEPNLALTDLAPAIHSVWQDHWLPNPDSYLVTMLLLAVAEQGRWASINAGVSLSELRGAGLMTLPEMLAAIEGEQVVTLTDLLTAIGNVDLSSVLDELAAIRTVNDWTLGDLKTFIEDARGTDLPTIRDVLVAIAAIPGIDPADLQAILDAIAGVRGAGNPDLADVLAAIAAVRGEDSPDLAAILTAIASLSTQVTNLSTQVESTRLDIDGNILLSESRILAALGLEIGTTLVTFLTNSIKQPILNAIAGIAVNLQPVLDAIAALRGDTVSTVKRVQELTTHLVNHKARRYAGVGTVEYLAAQDVENIATIYGDMHGCLVQITSDVSKYGVQVAGNLTRYPRLGFLTFIDDNGHWDGRQQIEWQLGNYAPLSLSRAAGVTVRCKPGTTMTVIPWREVLPA